MVRNALMDSGLAVYRRVKSDCLCLVKRLMFNMLQNTPSVPRCLRRAQDGSARSGQVKGMQNGSGWSGQVRKTVGSGQGYAGRVCTVGSGQGYAGRVWVVRSGRRSGQVKGMQDGSGWSGQVGKTVWTWREEAELVRGTLRTGREDDMDGL